MLPQVFIGGIFMSKKIPCGGFELGESLEVKDGKLGIAPVDQKYIPPQTVYVNITENEDGSYSADKTFVEIMEQLNNGINVLVHVPDTPFVAYYAGIMNGRLLFSQTFAEGYTMMIVGIGQDNTIRVIIDAFMDYMLPQVTASDNGKFLRVVDGAWEASSDVIIPSSTSGSTKKFKITVDDTGTISSTEVTS